MSDTDPDAGSAVSDGEAGDSGAEPAFDRPVERGFTCSLCGYVMTHEVGLLRTRVESVCHNCGEWTTQVGDRAELAAAAEEAAATLAGPTLTERQALAYLLREVMDADREIAADVMDTSPSNVDNLHRRAAEKVEDADRVVDGLRAFRSGVEPGDVGASGDESGDAETGGE